MNDQEQAAAPARREILNPGYNRRTGRGKHSNDVGIKIMRSKPGGIARVAEAIKRTPASVGLWRHIPIEYVFEVARTLEVDPAALRPDFFIKDPLRANRARAYLDAGPTAPPRLPIRHEQNRTIWFDTLNYPTNAAAAAAIGESLGVTVSTDQLRRLFGKSGRATGYYRIAPTARIGAST